MNAQLLNRIDEFINNNQEAMFKDIAKLVAINSVESEPVENGPFGQGAKDALDAALSIADSLGLETRNYEGYMGEASIGGDGEKYLATITHADVVPAGDGWKADPFIMREKDGYILGRGVIDDKGPTVLCFYMLKCLKELGIELKYPVRALIGANEETGMKDLEYFIKNCPLPAFCFSPDAEFPLICGEKGIWHGKVTSNCKNESVLEITGGVAANALASTCKAKVKAVNLKSTDCVEATDNGDGTYNLTATGLSGHASTPWLGKSAIGIMIKYILDNNIVSGEEKAFFEEAYKIHEDYSGKNIGVNASAEDFTDLTIVSGVIGVEDRHFCQSIDIRYVPSVDGQWVYEKLNSAFAAVGKIENHRDNLPFYKSPESPEIQVCMNAYNFVTGENVKPFTIGGGTYSRDLPNAVGFGPEHPERPMPEFVGSMHGAEEGVSKADMLEALKIYIISMIDLQELEF